MSHDERRPSRSVCPPFAFMHANVRHFFDKRNESPHKNINKLSTRHPHGRLRAEPDANSRSPQPKNHYRSTLRRPIRFGRDPDPHQTKKGEWLTPLFRNRATPSGSIIMFLWLRTRLRRCRAALRGMAGPFQAVWRIRDPPVMPCAVSRPSLELPTGASLRQPGRPRLTAVAFTNYS